MRISDWSSDVCSSDLRWRSASSRSVNAALPYALRLTRPLPLPEVSRPIRVAVATETDLRGVRAGCGASATGAGASTATGRSEEHTYELQSLMRNSYAVFCLKKNKLALSLTRLRSTHIVTFHHHLNIMS